MALNHFFNFTTLWFSIKPLSGLVKLKSEKLDEEKVLHYKDSPTTVAKDGSTT